MWVSLDRRLTHMSLHHGGSREGFGIVFSRVVSVSLVFSVKANKVSAVCVVFSVIYLGFVTLLFQLSDTCMGIRHLICWN
jgi:type IV secretory pathway TrbL component